MAAQLQIAIEEIPSRVRAEVQNIIGAAKRGEIRANYQIDRFKPVGKDDAVYCGSMFIIGTCDLTFQELAAISDIIQRRRPTFFARLVSAGNHLLSAIGLQRVPGLSFQCPEAKDRPPLEPDREATYAEIATALAGPFLLGLPQSPANEPGNTEQKFACDKTSHSQNQKP